MKSVGARAIATTRGAGKKDFLLNIGADRVVVTDEEDLAESVMEITGGVGANVIFDPVVGSFLTKLADAAAYHGTIFSYGHLSPDAPVLPLYPAIRKGLTFRGYTIMEISRDTEKREVARKFIYDGLESGAFKPIIAKTFPLDEIVGAYKYMESNAQMGKNRRRGVTRAAPESTERMGVGVGQLLARDELEKRGHALFGLSPRLYERRADFRRVLHALRPSAQRSGDIRVFAAHVARAVFFMGNRHVRGLHRHGGVLSTTVQMGRFSRTAVSKSSPVMPKAASPMKFTQNLSGAASFAPMARPSPVPSWWDFPQPR